ncbi:MAG: AAA family ATPase [Gemmataceae bacterium]
MNVSELLKSLTDLLHDGAGGIVALLLGFGGGFLTAHWFHRRNGRREIARLQAENEVLRALEDKAREIGKELILVRDQMIRIARTAMKFREGGLSLQQELERERGIVQRLSKKLDAAKSKYTELKTQHGATRAELDELQAQLNRLDNVVEGTGSLWLRDLPPPTDRPPLSKQMPVVAVVNFKGGVGKTTLAANLAPALASHGERVLVIDLDYQGALTALAMLPGDIRRAAAEHRLVQDLLQSEPLPDLLRRLAVPCGDPEERFHVIGATEPLADTESWLMARWLVRLGSGDARFVLRTAIDTARERGDFDRVLIDCPPRLTTACVNALACCNYALVPALLDRTSSPAVPHLLGLLKQFQPLLGGLPGVGIVANRTTRTPLPGDELDVWDELATQCREVWGRPVDRFATTVPQRYAFRDAANRHRIAVQQDREIRDIFARLADELIERVPREGHRSAPVTR